MSSDGSRRRLGPAGRVWVPLLLVSAVVVLALWKEPAGAREIPLRSVRDLASTTLLRESTLPRSPSRASSSAPEGAVLINEIQYHSTLHDADPAYQWFELFNTTDADLNLGGWTVSAAVGSDVLPNLVLPAKGFAVVAASEHFHEEYPDVPGLIVTLDGAIGSGWNEDGDRLALFDGEGGIIDAISYGIDASWLNPPCPAVPKGVSLERVILGWDTDKAVDFAGNLTPSPGSPPATAPTPTPSPTSQTPALIPTASATPSPVSVSDATRTPTATKTAKPTASATPSPTASATPIGGEVEPGEILINEVQYQAGPSTAGGDDPDHEWVELYNASGRLVSLADFTLSDNRGSDRLPGFLFEPGTFVIIASTERFREDYPDVRATVIYLADGRFGNSLSNNGDRLVLRNPAGLVVDAMSYGTDDTVFSIPRPVVARGHSFERRLAGLDTDNASDFVDNPSPSPGTSLGGLPPVSMRNTLFLPSTVIDLR